jgi:hypothetical protein
MSNALAGFALKRTRTQALGFYIVWLIGGSIITATLLYIYMCLSNGQMPEGMDVVGLMRVFQSLRLTVGSFVICGFSLLLAALVIGAKKQYTRTALICVLLTAFLSLLGLIFSLLPVAYLTTLPQKAS